MCYFIGEFKGKHDGYSQFVSMSLSYWGSNTAPFQVYYTSDNLYVVGENGTNVTNLYVVAVFKKT